MGVLGYCWQGAALQQPERGEMFSSIRKAKILIPFFYDRLGDYADLARLDFIQFRSDTIRSIVGGDGRFRGAIATAEFHWGRGYRDRVGDAASHPHCVACCPGLEHLR